MSIELLEEKLFFIEVDIESTKNSLAHLEEVAQKYRNKIKELKHE